jgi:hypothetical protein
MVPKLITNPFGLLNLQLLLERIVALAASAYVPAAAAGIATPARKASASALRVQRAMDLSRYISARWIGRGTNTASCPGHPVDDRPRRLAAGTALRERW